MAGSQCWTPPEFSLFGGNRAGPASDMADLRAAFITRMREVPGAVAIIATSHEGRKSGLTATAWCSVCADPPSLLVCVNRTASAHDAILVSGVFSINQLTSENHEVLAVFSNQRGLRGDDRFLAEDWHVAEGRAPLLLQALTAYECEMVARLSYNTHSIFIGRVTNLLARGDPMDPAVYFKGSLCGVYPAGA